MIASLNNCQLKAVFIKTVLNCNSVFVCHKFCRKFCPSKSAAADNTLYFPIAFTIFAAEIFYLVLDIKCVLQCFKSGTVLFKTRNSHKSRLTTSSKNKVVVRKDLII